MSEQSFVNYITEFAKSAPESSPVPWYDNYFKPLKGKALNEEKESLEIKKPLKGKALYKEKEFLEIKNRVVTKNDSENDFNNVWRKLEHSLTRNDLFGYFTDGSDESLYKGYVATMLWGGIGTGGGSKANLKNAMSQPKSEIIERIKNIRDVLDGGNEYDVRAAFIMMTKEYGRKFRFNGKTIRGAKIPGIDISYFTKLLFFLGNKDWDYQPLVYDNQLQNVHCALLKDDGIGLQSLFDIHSFKMDSFSISCRISPIKKNLGKPVDFYIDFIERVKSLSKSMELSGNCEVQGKAGRLEEIMFGVELTRKKSENDPKTNPRAFVRNYLGLTEYSEEQSDQSNNEGKASMNPNSTTTTLDTREEGTSTTDFSTTITLCKIKGGFYVKEFSKNHVDPNTVAKVTLCVGNQRYTLTDHFKNILSGGLFPRTFNDLLKVSGFDTNVKARFRISDAEMILDL